MKAVFDAMKQISERLNASPKARYLMEGFTRDIFLADTQGDETVLVRIADGSMDVRRQAAGDGGIVVEVANASRLLPVIQGKLDISHPIAEGAMSVTRGKVSDLVLFNRILAAS